MPFSPLNVILFHSYTQQICQSHPQNFWHKLPKFNKLSLTEFVCVKTNLSTELINHSVTFTYIYRSRDSDHIHQPHLLTDSILLYWSAAIWPERTVNIATNFAVFLRNQSLATANMRPFVFWNVT